MCIPLFLPFLNLYQVVYFSIHIWTSSCILDTSQNPHLPQKQRPDTSNAIGATRNPSASFLFPFPCLSTRNWVCGLLSGDKIRSHQLALFKSSHPHLKAYGVLCVIIENKVVLGKSHPWFLHQSTQFNKISIPNGEFTPKTPHKSPQTHSTKLMVDTPHPNSSKDSIFSTPRQI